MNGGATRWRGRATAWLAALALSGAPAWSQTAADPAPTTATTAETPAPDPTELAATIEAQRQRIDELERRNAAQEEQLAAMQLLLEQLNRRLAELEGQPAVPVAELEERLAQLESSAKERPEIPPDVVSAGDFPGSFKVPGSSTAIRIGGQVWTSLVHTLDALGSDDRFLTYSIPVEGTPEAGKGRRLSLWAGPSRFNFDVRTPTSVGQMRAFIEGDFAGDANGFRLRHAYLQYGDWLIGQTWSTFSDPDADHEDVDFEGMNAENVIRQPQLRWSTRLADELRLALAVELSRASITGGESVNQIPDLIARLRRNFSGGHLQAALVLKQVRAELAESPNVVHSQEAWGLSLSGVVPVRAWADADRVVFQVNGGHGVARYVNDLQSAGGLDGVFDPVTGALELPYEWGFFVDYEHHWPDFANLGFNDLRSSFIWGYVSVDPLAIQPDDAYRRTNRLSLNLIWSPIEHLDVAVEGIYGSRQNKDGQRGTATQLQARLRYLF